MLQDSPGREGYLINTEESELESVCDVSLSSFSPQFPEQADMQVNTVFEMGKTYLPLRS